MVTTSSLKATHRKLLESMREPTPAMIRAWEKTTAFVAPEDDEARVILGWRAMVDELIRATWPPAERNPNEPPL